MKLQPKEFGLPARTELEQIDATTIGIVINRKSRIIMADGKKIAEKAEQIRRVAPLATVVLKTTAPVCSKTIPYLESKGICLV